MTSSRSAIQASYDRLKGSLDALLSGQDHELTVLQDSGSSLMLLRTKDDVGGFIVLNGISKEDSYRTGYDFFKGQFRQRHSEWAGKALFFVVCRTSDDPSEDSFYGKIENDVYFCRKYVVRLGTTDDQLREGLLRLPTLPLGRYRSPGPERPVSAQTLLRRAGMPSIWAERIVRSGQYSSTSFVRDIIAESFPLDLKAADRESTAPLPIEPVAERVRVRSIEISAFRAYKRVATFDLDADVIVLYGQNGVGKTSFFDAMDFVCTGRIGRLQEGSRGSAERNLAINRHLDTTGESSYVKLQLGGASESALQRRVHGWDSALYGNEREDRKAIIAHLTAARWSDEVPRIDNLEKLFRATHLFSQSRQELLSQFGEASLLPSDVVSRMFSLEDYTSAIRKCEEVLAQIAEQKNDLGSKISVQDETLQKLRSEMQTLSTEHGSESLPEALSRYAREVGQELAEVMDISAVGHLEELPSVREHRKALSAEVERLQSRVAALRKAMRRWKEIEKLRADTSDLNGRIGQIDASMEPLKAERSRVEQSHAQLRAATQRLVSERESTEREIASFDRLIAFRKDLQTAVAEQSKMEAGKSALEALRERLGRDGTAVLERIRAHRAQIDDARRALEVAESRLAASREVLSGLLTWRKNRDEVSVSEERAAQSQRVINEAKASIESTQLDISRASRELSTAEEELRTLSEDHAELIRLLDSIEGHISGSECPVCGVNHGSREELIRRVALKKQQRPSVLQSKADACQTIAKQLEDSRLRARSLTVARDQRQIELRQLRARIAELSPLIRATGQQHDSLGLSGADAEIEAAARRIEADAVSSVLGEQERIGESSKALALSESAKNDLDSRMAHLVEQLRAANGRLEQAQVRVRLARNRVAEFAFSAKFDEQELQRRKQAAQERIKLIQLQHLKSVEDSGVAERSIDGLRRELEGKTAERDTLEIGLSNNLQTLGSFDAELASLDLSVNDTLEALSQKPRSWTPTGSP